jgi:hypothetical protein
MTRKPKSRKHSASERLVAPKNPIVPGLGGQGLAPQVLRSAALRNSPGKLQDDPERAYNNFPSLPRNLFLSVGAALYFLQNDRRLNKWSKENKKMTTRPSGPSSTENPRQIFESALSLMEQGRGSVHRGTPIVARGVAIAPTQNEQATEKRALTDAARALARLWNVSPHLVR